MSKLWVKITLIVAIAISVAGYNLWVFIGESFFDKCNAVFLVLLFTVLKDNYKKEKHLDKISEIGFWFSINNLADEFIFDPNTFGINEYIFAAWVVYLVFKIK